MVNIIIFNFSATSFDIALIQTMGKEYHKKIKTLSDQLPNCELSNAIFLISVETSWIF